MYAQKDQTSIAVPFRDQSLSWKLYTKKNVDSNARSQELHPYIYIVRTIFYK